MDSQVKTFISNFFIIRGKFATMTEDEYSDLNFVESNILDSIEFITLIADIEENFDFVFSEEELQSSSFTTIDGITQIVNKKLINQ